jgi:hypothetical protein
VLSWILSIVVAMLTGIAALFVAGLIASLCVDWYRISSFEGGSGYFVVFTALGGAVAGLFVGLVVARLIANSTHAGFLNALGASLARVWRSGARCHEGRRRGDVRLGDDRPHDARLARRPTLDRAGVPRRRAMDRARRCGDLHEPGHQGARHAGWRR